MMADHVDALMDDDDAKISMHVRVLVHVRWRHAGISGI